MVSKVELLQRQEKKMNKEAKATIVLVAAVPFIWCATRACAADLLKADWRLCIQAWTFNRFTFYETVDKTKALGLRYIEAYPGQQLSKEEPDVKFDHNASAQIREEVKNKLQEAGVKLVNYGVVKLPNNEQECRKVFDFAKDMGIETIVSEPPEDAFELVDKLCNEYKINVAIHNHPKPSHYWDPNTVLGVCKGRSNQIGACADTGHWFRSGLNPLESLKKLEGHIISLHFKDLSEGHDVIWGTGKCDARAMLTELARQNFKGTFSIEYEYNWENSMPEIAQCISFFQKTAAELGRTTSESEKLAVEPKPAGWQEVFNGKDLNDFEVKGERNKAKWVVGTAAISPNNPKLLMSKGSGSEMINLAAQHGDSLDIYSKARFGDCRIELELMVPQGSNSGIYLMGEYEIQVLDSYGKAKMGNGDMGAVYGAAPPPVNACKKPGEWQKYVIEFIAPKFDANGKKTANARLVKVELNGQVLHENLELPGPTPGGITGKESPTGPLMFQGDHGPVAYRNIWVAKLH
jgi:sugar phosphate isomerase/epimerase